MSGLLAAQESSVDSEIKGEVNKNNSDEPQSSSTFIYVSENTTIVNLSEIKNATVIIVDKKEISPSSSPNKNSLKKKDTNVLLAKKTLSKEVEERLKKNIPINYQVGNGNDSSLFVYKDFGNKTFCAPFLNKDLKSKNFVAFKFTQSYKLIYDGENIKSNDIDSIALGVYESCYFSRPPPVYVFLS